MLKEFRKRLRRKRLQRRADVHLISFPKCGRTWLVLMISKAIEEHYGVTGVDPLRPYRYTRKVRGLPFILPHHDGGPEFKRVAELETDKSRYAGKKVIFLVRDPRDVTVSSYFQKTKRNVNYQGSLRDYVYEPVGSVETNIAFYNIWAQNRRVPEDFLLVTYEDLQADAEGQLRRVLDFLGLASVGDEAVHRAVEFCRFDNMRQMEATNSLGSKRLAPRDAGDEATYKTREGRIGGYADHLEPTEIDYINRLIRERLDPLYRFYYDEPAADGAEDG
ncbi:MAG TPA: sulfotransferase domain-containing protein [Gammaproteobacteria bacterium]|nr:sulfotransferase domain-containing protein [Gammaproteobacteria bacterium]